MEIRLIQGNTFEELVVLSRQITNFLEEHEAPMDAIFATELTLEEFITNTVKYGYDDEERHEIEVVVGIEDSMVTIIVTDDGHPFDPLAQAAPNLDVPADEREIGGLGIHLVKNLMTDLSYERSNDRNIVTARRAFGAAAEDAPDK